jgi:hypothetical protein
MRKNSLVKIAKMLSFTTILFVGLFAPGARAATRTVDTTSDNGSLTACTAAANDCSLRGAISGAAAGDTINFDAGLTNQTIVLNGEITLNRSLTVTGPGADKLTISGGGANRLFSYFGGATLNLNFSNLTFASGNGTGANNTNQGGAFQINGGATTAIFDGVVFANNSASAVGGVLLFNGGSCSIKNSLVSGNSGGDGSVFYHISGTLEITNSTFSGNTANRFGIGYSFSAAVKIANSTIVNNTGGGLYKDSGTMTLVNTIVAGNGSFDVNRAGGAIATGGGNLIGSNAGAGANFSTAGAPNANGDYIGTSASQINPLLAPLGNYGGATQTYALLSNSPALNHGNNCVITNACSISLSASLTNDQRGAARQSGAAVDIGAFEADATYTAVLPGGRVSQSYNTTLTANNGSFAFTQTGGMLPPGLSLTTAFAPGAIVAVSGTPTMAGNYSFAVTASNGVNSVTTNYSLAIASSSTAAGVSISGRVFTPDGRGLMNAFVVMRDPSGNGSARTTRTTAFGYYRFDEVQAGQTCIFTVVSKRYQFTPRIVSIFEELTDLNFTATQ